MENGLLYQNFWCFHTINENLAHFCWKLVENWFVKVDHFKPCFHNFRIVHCLWKIYIKIGQFHLFWDHLTTFTFLQLWDWLDYASSQCVVEKFQVVQKAETNLLFKKAPELQDLVFTILAWIIICCFKRFMDICHTIWVFVEFCPNPRWKQQTLTFYRENKATKYWTGFLNNRIWSKILWIWWKWR